MPILIFLVSFFASSSVLKVTPASDLTALQGTWKAWRSPDEVIVIEVSGKKFTMTQHVGDRAAESSWTGTIVLDETQSPRHMTWTGVRAGEKDLPENKCIYELMGDTWLLIGGGSEKRPDRFLSGGGPGNQTLVLKREKK
jgi:uncharacterized protein (TIGR03067 family)